MILRGMLQNRMAMPIMQFDEEGSIKSSEVNVELCPDKGGVVGCISTSLALLLIFVDPRILFLEAFASDMRPWFCSQTGLSGMSIMPKNCIIASRPPKANM